tara:strand:- start:199 stop:780 length:582 start_codon:yes stop_codon:yes gene_type:complete
MAAARDRANPGFRRLAGMAMLGRIIPMIGSDHQMHFVLGAPGSGKTAIVDSLRALLPGWTIIDWDMLMAPAGRLAGCSIRLNQATWRPYQELMRAVAALSPPERTLLLGVCTPAELADWPGGHWLLLDCADDERLGRLQRRGESNEVVQAAIEDAAAYRALALPALDTTRLTPADVAQQLAQHVAAGDRDRVV